MAARTGSMALHRLFCFGNLLRLVFGRNGGHVMARTAV